MSISEYMSICSECNIEFRKLGNDQDKCIECLRREVSRVRLFARYKYVTIDDNYIANVDANIRDEFKAAYYGKRIRDIHLIALSNIHCSVCDKFAPYSEFMACNSSTLIHSKCKNRIYIPMAIRSKDKVKFIKMLIQNKKITLLTSSQRKLG